MSTLVTISICDVTVTGDSLSKRFCSLSVSANNSMPLASSVAILAVLLLDLAGFSHC